MHAQTLTCSALMAIFVFSTIQSAITDDGFGKTDLTKAHEAFDKHDFKSAVHYSTKSINGDSDALYSVEEYNLRGSAYNNLGQYSKAIADYSHSLKLQVDQAEIYYFRANSYESNGEYAKAISDYTKAIDLGPPTQSDTYNAYGNLAWLLATCPEKNFRNGKQAVENANAAWESSMKKTINITDTLAAAYAEAGDFLTAIKWEQQFLATPGLKTNDSEDGKKRLALYEAGKPYREKRY